MAYARLYPNQLGVVVTHLEMTAPPPPVAEESSLGLRLERIAWPSLERYKALIGRVGQDWLWFIDETEEELRQLLSDPKVIVCAVQNEAGEDVGILELHFKTPGECMLDHVGLIPSLIGKGYGRWLIDQALRLAWGGDVKRVQMSTCTLDHPRALAAYIGAGFVPTGRAVASFVDPRVRGLLPRDAAPNVPIIEDGPVLQEARKGTP